MARTRPDAPKLLPQDYGRANYLRREVQLAKDYQHVHAGTSSAAAIGTFLGAVGDGAVVTDGQVFDLHRLSAHKVAECTAVVVGDTVTKMELEENTTTISNGETIPVFYGEDSLLAAASATSWRVTLPGTASIVKDAGSVTVGGSTYTFAVADGVITGITVT